ncbi:MAG: gyrase subunit, partial [Pseudonocardiales bacterium]|nr:gyrase subunit [Pseudonocardiales bacterium]
MTDITEPPSSYDRIEPVDLQTEMQRSYIDYAMSVIVGRALPDVRDGLKPVHRKILYGMYDSGFRPDRNYVKCGRVVGDVMGNYHPHGDSALYDALVRMAQPWSLRYPLIDPQGNFGSPGNDPAAAYRYTECRLQNLAMEMLRDIDKATVDYVPNYAGNTTEPVILPARFPNLLVNGSEGIAVGMATRIPPHNLREVASGVVWALDHPDATDEELLEKLIELIQGPDFPTRGLIVGRDGIEDAYRTGRGSIRMRAVVEVEADQKGATILVVTELPYQVNPDNLVESIAQLVKDGKISGIRAIHNESSDRIGMRIVITLSRDGVAKVVLNNLFKHTQLQTTFGANMLAIVDGVPRTLRIDQFVSHYVEHQVEVIVRRTQFLLQQAEERAHILRALLKALDQLDAVIALIRSAPSAEES